MYEMTRRNVPSGTLPFSFLRVARDLRFYVQCFAIDRASHTRPLMTLLGVLGERVGQQGIKPNQSVLPFLHPWWTQHNSGIELIKSLCICVSHHCLDGFSFCTIYLFLLKVVPADCPWKKSFRLVS